MIARCAASAMMKQSMIGLLVGKYRIEAEIGRGAMGIVFKAQDTVLGRFVALKILAEKLANDPEMLYRFEREGGAASALRHPNICTYSIAAIGRGGHTSRWNCSPARRSTNV